MQNTALYTPMSVPMASKIAPLTHPIYKPPDISTKSSQPVVKSQEQKPATTELQTKDQLIEKIKEWVKIDNEIRTLQKEISKRKTTQKRVSSELMDVMRTNEIDAFDINDGQILYDKRSVKKPITKTALLSILSEYYKGDVLKASEINQYIMDNREEVVREKIVRKLNKGEK